jgi:hypothetical protein
VDYESRTETTSKGAVISRIKSDTSIIDGWAIGGPAFVQRRALREDER